MIPARGPQTMCFCCYATSVAQSSVCNRWCAIFVVQYVLCNRCCATVVVQSLLCTLCCATGVAQPLVCPLWCATFVVKSLLCGLCCGHPKGPLGVPLDVCVGSPSTSNGYILAAFWRDSGDILAILWLYSDNTLAIFWQDPGLGTLTTSNPGLQGLRYPDDEQSWNPGA